MTTITTSDHSPRSRDEWIARMRLWVAPLLRISEQAAHQLLSTCDTNELTRVSLIKLEPPRVKTQLLKSLVEELGLYARLQG